MKFISIVGYLAMVTGLVALFATHSLFSTSLFVIIPQAFGVALLIWARITFGRRSFHLAANPTEGGLVTNGPYRYVRNPIYTAMCLFTLAGAAAHWGWSTAFLAGLVLGGALVRIHCEESLLVIRYPQYPHYAAKTPRMIPFVF